MTEHDNNYEDTSVSQSEAHTPEWLRSFKGCEHYSDDEALEILGSLDIMAHILLFAGEHTSDQKTIVIPFENPINKKAA
ncbi:MAG: hypothetical protein BGO70_16625 [Bacteroidetes bacterium 43-93]|nr:hypothetical protein [Bacteroidota bacterium]OJX01388.1 MAG: hypothetical protein BGO70_16625 [Bacteroidetes bacterium 43-93]